MAAYEFMYLTPSIQALIRDNKVFRIDSDIQTGKKWGMELLDDNLFRHFMSGKISKEEAIDKSKNPANMADKMRRAGIDPGIEEDEAESEAGAAAANGSGAATAQSEAERQAQMAKNRARMSGQK